MEVVKDQIRVGGLVGSPERVLAVWAPKMRCSDRSSDPWRLCFCERNISIRKSCRSDPSAENIDRLHVRFRVRGRALLVSKIRNRGAPSIRGQRSNARVPGWELWIIGSLGRVGGSLVAFSKASTLILTGPKLSLIIEERGHRSKTVNEGEVRIRSPRTRAFRQGPARTRATSYLPPALLAPLRCARRPAAAKACPESRTFCVGRVLV